MSALAIGRGINLTEVLNWHLEVVLEQPDILGLVWFIRTIPKLIGMESFVDLDMFVSRLGGRSTKLIRI